MKRFLLFSTLIVFLSSCSQTVIVPEQRSIAGTWVLSEASRSDGFGWQYFRSALEEGVFDFYRNGDAEYEDGYSLMRGTWRIRTVAGGYYDQHGNYHDRVHDIWEVNVRDPYNRTSIDMFFDEIVVYNDRIIATHYDGYYIQRYIFRRI
jgi:hypothetical protein